MDALYRGLAAPRRVIPIGREDLAPDARPGAALAGLAREALEAGAFPPAPALAQPDDAALEPVRISALNPGPAAPGHDDDGFEEGDDLDPPAVEESCEFDEGLDT